MDVSARFNHWLARVSDFLETIKAGSPDHQHQDVDARVRELLEEYEAEAASHHSE